jgi:hypothetical protein
MGIVLFAYTTSFLILPADENDPNTESLKPSFNSPGTITGVISLVLFNFAWNQAGAVGWTTPHTYILLIVGILFGRFVYLEIYVVRDPLVPIKSLPKEAIHAFSIIACDGPRSGSGYTISGNYLCKFVIIAFSHQYLSQVL